MNFLIITLSLLLNFSKGCHNGEEFLLSCTPSPSPTSNPYGVRYIGSTIDSSSDEDCITIWSDGVTPITIDTCDTMNGLDTIVRIWDQGSYNLLIYYDPDSSSGAGTPDITNCPTCQVISYGACKEQESITVLLPSGQYLLGIDQWGTWYSSPTYYWWVRMLGNDNACTTPSGNIYCKDTISTTLTAWDVKTYIFESIGYPITFDTCSSNFDTKIYIFDNNGLLLVQVDNGYITPATNSYSTSTTTCNGGNSEQLTLTLPAGTYKVGGAGFQMLGGSLVLKMINCVTYNPTIKPTSVTLVPTKNTRIPTGNTPSPTDGTNIPTGNTPGPTLNTKIPTGSTPSPTDGTKVPTKVTVFPTKNSVAPTKSTLIPTVNTGIPTLNTFAPSDVSNLPTLVTRFPTKSTNAPSETSNFPTKNTVVPTKLTKEPSKIPTKYPTKQPTKNPTKNPTTIPTKIPTNIPTFNPTKNPTKIPTNVPSTIPTSNPTKNPTKLPTTSPIAYDGEIRLVGGSTNNQGRVEIYNSSRSSWINMCDSQTSNNNGGITATAICNTLGYNYGGIYFNNDDNPYGTSTLGSAISMNDIICPLNGTNLANDCQYSVGATCDNVKGIGVYCYLQESIRLINSAFNEGLLEIIDYQNPTIYGTVCDDVGTNAFGLNLAKVVCRQLGCLTTNMNYKCGKQGIAPCDGTAHTWGSGGSIIIDEIRCVGNENFITECPLLTDYKVSDCGSTEHIGIICDCGTQTPSTNPTAFPTKYPTTMPTQLPTITPTSNTKQPSTIPTKTPSNIPTTIPTANPSETPTQTPSNIPTSTPSKSPSFTHDPTKIPTTIPTQIPSIYPTTIPTLIPTLTPSNIPTNIPSNNPSLIPTNNPSFIPTILPTLLSNNPTINTIQPTLSTQQPTKTTIITTIAAAKLGILQSNPILIYVIAGVAGLICCLLLCFGIFCCFCYKKFRKQEKMLKSLTSDPMALAKIQSMSSLSQNSTGFGGNTSIELQNNNALMLNTLASLSKDGGVSTRMIADIQTQNSLRGIGHMAANSLNEGNGDISDKQKTLLMQRKIAEQIYRDATLALQSTNDEGGLETTNNNAIGLMPFSDGNNNNENNEDENDGDQDTGGFTKGNETESSESNHNNDMYGSPNDYGNTNDGQNEAEPSIDM